MGTDLRRKRRVSFIVSTTPSPRPSPKRERGNNHFTTSYALTLRDNSHRQRAQIKKSMNQEAHNGGSDMITSPKNPTLPSRSTVWLTKVPNNPEHQLRIKAPST